jgi:hypothetical protein
MLGIHVIEKHLGHFRTYERFGFPQTFQRGGEFRYAFLFFLRHVILLFSLSVLLGISNIGQSGWWGWSRCGTVRVQSVVPPNGFAVLVVPGESGYCVLAWALTSLHPAMQKPTQSNWNAKYHSTWPASRSAKAFTIATSPHRKESMAQRSFMSVSFFVFVFENLHDVVERLFEFNL